MAKYTVSHSCGHDQTHQLFGPHKERDRKLAWLEGTLCTECYHADRERKNAEASAKAAEANRAAALPELTGSEKQVAWAESIRRPICALLHNEEVWPIGSPALSAIAAQEIRDAAILLVDEICQQAEAKWWIETGRNLDLRSPSHVSLYMIKQIRERHLAPTAEAEIEALNPTSRQAEEVD